MRIARRERRETDDASIVNNNNDFLIGKRTDRQKTQRKRNKTMTFKYTRSSNCDNNTFTILHAGFLLLFGIEKKKRWSLLARLCNGLTVLCIYKRNSMRSEMASAHAAFASYRRRNWPSQQKWCGFGFLKQKRRIELESVSIWFHNQIVNLT